MIPTSSSPEVIRTALALLREIYREGVLYKKASVMLLNLQDANAVKSQGVLFDMGGRNPEEQQRDDTLMETVDKINRSLQRQRRHSRQLPSDSLFSDCVQIIIPKLLLPRHRRFTTLRNGQEHNNHPFRKVNTAFMMVAL